MPPPAREQVMRAVVPIAALATAAASGAAGAGADPGQPPRQPEVRAFKPVADTYVTSAAPRTNFGRARVLRADGAPVTTTYLRFDLRGRRGDPESAILLLHRHGTTRTRYEVRRVPSDEWSERRLTYENAPRVSPRYASSTAARHGRWSAVDVTPFVHGNEVNLAITTRSPRGVSFGSRESRYGPRLAVEMRTEGSEPALGPFEK